MKRLYFLLVFAAACAPTSLKDLRSEGEAETRKLAVLLSEIETKEQLQKKFSSIQSSYGKIADLVIERRHLSGVALEEPSGASDALFAQLARLYEMPGCRRLLEAAQEQAIHKLQK